MFRIQPVVPSRQRGVPEGEVDRFIPGCGLVTIATDLERAEDQGKDEERHEHRTPGDAGWRAFPRRAAEPGAGYEPRLCARWPIQR